MSVFLLILIYYIFKDSVKNWYAHQIDIIKTVSAYELGIYITLGVLLVLFVIFAIGDYEFLKKLAYGLFGGMIALGVVLGFKNEGWHWIFSLLLILYFYSFKLYRDIASEY